MELVANPQMEATHYGITLTHIGDEGDMLALGHHSPRRALAAFNRHARLHVGLANLVDDTTVSAGDFEDDIKQEWAVFRKPDPESDGWEGAECDWIADFEDAEAPGAQPVTVLNLA